MYSPEHKIQIRERIAKPDRRHPLLGPGGLRGMNRAEGAPRGMSKSKAHYSPAPLAGAAEAPERTIAN